MMISNEYLGVADYGYIRSQSINLAPMMRRFFYAAQQQAGADGCPAGDHEAPQLSLSVRPPREIMRIKHLCFLFIALVPHRAFAGDCWSHPMFIHEMEIRSCELISEANAGRVSKGATPTVVAARYPGVILEGTQQAIRQIDLEEPFRDIKFAVHPWQKKDLEKTFLFQSKALNDCSTFKLGTRVKFASFTNCECDTGPAPDGYCALTVQQVTTIPNEYLKYTE